MRLGLWTDCGLVTGDPCLVTANLPSNPNIVYVEGGRCIPTIPPSGMLMSMSRRWYGWYTSYHLSTKQEGEGARFPQAPLPKLSRVDFYSVIMLLLLFRGPCCCCGGQGGGGVVLTHLNSKCTHQCLVGCLFVDIVNSNSLMSELVLDQC